jgi:DNA methyltransferase 1-associated protein 1
VQILSRKLALSGLKGKRNANKTKRWMWKPFANSARKDNATFHHWVRADAELSDYPFARFNKPVDVFQFTEVEYDKYITNNKMKPDIAAVNNLNVQSDAFWTKEETLLLFDLLKKYELCWPVVFDNYVVSSLESDKFKAHSIEQMKERYYSISTRILFARLHDASLKFPEKILAFYEQSMKAFQSLNYNPDAEQRKRKQIDAAFRRSNESLSQERAIMKELKAIEVTIRKTAAKGGKFLSNILETPDSSSPLTGSLEYDQKPIVPTLLDANTGSASVPVVVADLKKTKGRPRKSVAVEGPLLAETGAQLPSKPYVDPFTSAVALRSAQVSAPLNAPGPNLATMRKAKEMIQGLRISERPIPTSRVLPVYHSLLRETSELIELAKEVDEAEKKVKMLPPKN